MIQARADTGQPAISLSLASAPSLVLTEQESQVSTVQVRNVIGMAATPTLDDAEKHIVYEIEAMCRAASRYAEEVGATVNQATPSDWHDAVFFLEASLIHARSLVILFGYPGKKERGLLRVLGLPKGHRKAFQSGFSHPTASASKAYGQLSELIAHVGATRWEAPLNVDVHQPVEVAVAVLDALENCGVADKNAAIRSAIDDGRQRVTNAV